MKKRVPVIAAVAVSGCTTNPYSDARERANSEQPGVVGQLPGH